MTAYAGLRSSGSMLRRLSLTVWLLACGDDLAGSGGQDGTGAGAAQGTGAGAAQGGATSVGGAAGTILWERSTLASNAIGTDEQGNLYVSAPGVDGDFGPQPPSIPVDFDAFTVTKLDPTGQNVLYRQTFPAQPGHMSVGRDGSLVITSTSVVIKLDADGNELWTSPLPPNGGPFVLSTDGRAWGPREVFDTTGAATQWRAAGGFVSLREYDAGEHVVGVKFENMNAIYSIDATSLSGASLWSKTVPAPIPLSAAPRLFMRAAGGRRTVIRQDIPQGDAGSTFDVGCGPLSSALIVLAADGSCEWSLPLPMPATIADTLPFSASNGVVMRSQDAIHLFGWDAGAELWSFTGDPQSQLIPTANEGNAVYVLSIHGGLGGLARVQ